MNRFDVTLPELRVICATALRNLLGRDFGVTIIPMPAIAGANWEVTAIDPLPNIALLTQAMEVVAELQSCFTLLNDGEKP